MARLFVAELKHSWILFRRYPGEAVGQLVFLAALFYALFLGASYLAGSPFEVTSERVDVLVLSYILWMLVIASMSQIAYVLQEEAMTGTLEQLYLSAFSPLAVFLTRALAKLGFTLALTAGMLLIIMVLTGSRLYFAPVALLPLATLLVGAYGVALAGGALALLLKRIQQLWAFVQFGFLFVLNIPFETWDNVFGVFGQLLPLTASVGLLRDVMVRGLPLNTGDWLIAALNSLIYFVLGLLVFQWADRLARQKGVVGGY